MHVTAGQFERSEPPAESSRPRRLADRVAWPFVIVCALLAFSVLIYSTRMGAGLTLDSQRYLDIAKGFPGSLGLAKPSADAPGRDVRYPPMLPIMLGMAKAFGGDPWVWARWFNGSLVIVNIVLVALLLFQTETQRGWPELWCVAMLATSIDLVSLHAFVWSEPLYLSFMLMMLIAMLKYLQNPNRVGMLLLAAVFAGLGCLTRYAGLSLILGGTLTVLLLSSATPRKRLLDAAIFGAVASGWLGLWVLGNLLSSGSATGRPLGYRPVPAKQFELLLYTMVNWWAPLQLSKPVRYALASVASLTLAVVLAMLFYLFSGGPRRPDRSLLLKLLSIFGVTYILFLIASRTFFDHATPLDYRILSPLFISAIIMCTLVIQWIVDRQPAPMLLTLLIGFFCIVMVPAYQTNTAIWAMKVSRTGLGYARARFTDPQLMEALEQIDPNARLYVNDLGLDMWVDRAVELIPDPEKTDRKLVARARDFRKELAARKTWLLFFTRKRKETEYIAVEIDGTLAKLTEEDRGAEWTLYSTEPLAKSTTQGAKAGQDGSAE